MVLDLEGNVLGQAYREYTLRSPEPGWTEIGGQFLIDLNFEIVRQAVVNSGVDPKDIKAISFSLQRSTFGLLDENLDIIEDTLINWPDARAVPLMDEINAKISASRRNEITGMPGGHVFAITKLYWFKAKRPEIYARTKYFANLDAILMRAFGGTRFAMEVTNATATGMIDVRTLDYCTELFQALSLDMDKLPPLCNPGDVMGEVTPEISAKCGLAPGTKVVAGSGDQQLAAMGAGVIRDGAASLTLGTVAMLAVGLAKPDFAALEGVMIPCSPVLGVFEAEGQVTSGATCYRWARDTFCQPEIEEAQRDGVDPYTIMEKTCIQASPPGANGVIFYSALFGTGYPHWDSDATGLFLGLRSFHTRADIVRSVMEGIVLYVRTIRDGMVATGVQMEDVITLTGGGSKSDGWCQIIADALNSKVRTLKVPDAAVVGAAGLAAIGAGLYGSVEEAVNGMVHFDREFEPIPANVAVYDETVKAYDEAYQGLKDRDVFAKLAKLRPEA
jgi:xylulokinase